MRIRGRWVSCNVDEATSSTWVDDGQRPGVTSEEHRRITELERENRELRRANEILKVAAAFLARELDPRLPT